MTFSTISLSATVDDKVIAITANAAESAVTIHTAIDVAGDYDEVELFANNHTSTAVELVILIGGTAAAEEIRKTIPAKDTKLILTGYKIASGHIIKAFCGTANAINVFGKVGRTV